ncbi:MAG: helix-turn-helix transcriptional regulator [Caldilineaceae bacterium]|nr:helix-turn-helix transcriptional regulator [Caldilineaceae bacterium]
MPRAREPKNRITRAQANRFSEALQSQLSDLEAEIQEYEALKAGDFAFGQLKEVAKLPRQLIRARIARGLSQRELADRLGLKEQQVQRYEASDYASASFGRIRDVVSALGMEGDHTSLADEGNTR